MKRNFQSQVVMILLLLCVWPVLTFSEGMSFLQNSSATNNDTIQHTEVLESMSIEELQVFMDSANRLASKETERSIFYAKQVLNSAELQNQSNIQVEVLLDLG